MLRSPDIQFTLFPETFDEFIERRARENSEWLAQFVASVNKSIDLDFHHASSFTHRSIAQRQRFHRERCINNGSINTRYRRQIS